MTTAALSAHLLPHTPKAFYRTALMAFFFIMGVIFASWAIRIPDVKVALHLSDAESWEACFLALRWGSWWPLCLRRG